MTITPTGQQNDIAALGQAVTDMLRKKNVLEIACINTGGSGSLIDQTGCDTFIDTHHGRLYKGSLVLFADNQYEGSSTPISRTDGGGNTYQMRTLKSEYEVVKILSLKPDFARLFDSVGARSSTTL